MEKSGDVSWIRMAFELYGILAGNLIPTTGENVKPAYGSQEEAFLNKVVTPIYKVIEKEALRSKTIKSGHSDWRNYDDVNEYFWSRDCFLLGWPMRDDADFFQVPHDAPLNKMNVENGHHWMGKVNFAEIRSLWHIFRSFDRMWSFLILSLQAMIIIARNGGRPSDIFDAGTFKQISSIFTTDAILKLFQSILGIVLSWKARRSMAFAVKLRYILKLLSSAAWVIILTVTYAYIWENPTGLGRKLTARLSDGRKHPTLYVHAVMIYLAPNMLAAILLFSPEFGRFLENSSIRVIRLMMWWSQECMQADIPFSSVVPCAYAPLSSESVVEGFLCYLTKMRYKIFHAMRAQQVKENNNVGVIIALWAPIILVYFMDIQIWYAIFSSLTGGINGLFGRLGESFTFLVMLACFVHMVFFGLNGIRSNKYYVILAMIKEMDMLRVPYYKDPEMDITQWPPFLLASKQKNKAEDKGQVIILFQDMLEVVTRDIMDEEPTE
ncbi:hypothetical protein TRIUR3_10709 [Triticum urartu]|uniref:1,3-beta-glucan synthase component FKS1-like domain-containing protein n=1 Tax=Triticum urartu TaxID=4572 RepID=M7ZNC5_TRIUA|nr:hypothetical protein TRIUR3_10709 [Triticum urartu]